MARYWEVNKGFRFFSSSRMLLRGPSFHTTAHGTLCISACRGLNISRNMKIIFSFCWCWFIYLGVTASKRIGRGFQADYAER